jgi:hypothetical protein
LINTVRPVPNLFKKFLLREAFTYPWIYMGVYPGIQLGVPR